MMVARRPVLATAALSLLLLSSGCSYLLLVAPSSVPVGGSATYVLELVNDEIVNQDLLVYTVAYVPAGWTLASAVFSSSGSPPSGVGVQVSDPGFACTMGPDLPPPGVGRQVVVVFWGTFDAVNPETATGGLTFAVGQSQGDFGVDFHVVLQKAASTVCSVGRGATTRVEPPIFADGFESGDTTAWSGSAP